jgi:S-adenosylmethionine/arginine decarboxylase-like enzyme
MKTISNIEREVNQIRLNIYEEKIYLMSNTKRLDKITQAAAQKYGFKIVVSAK